MATYTTFPHDHPHLTKCIICTAPIALDQAIPGSLQADGQQAFACEYHIQSRDVWITGWALFDIEQDAMTNSALRAKQAA